MSPSLVMGELSGKSRPGDRITEQLTVTDLLNYHTASVSLLTAPGTRGSMRRFSVANRKKTVNIWVGLWRSWERA
jgi:hypothetical protein